MTGAPAARRRVSTESCSVKRSPPRAPIVFAKACELGLEGIVSKREGSFYRSGKSRGWPKCLSTPAKPSDCDGCMVSTAHTMARLTAHTMATMAGPMIKPFMASPCA